MTLAPIILFVYNRPDHTCQTIEALLANPLAKDSELFIYSDAPKNQEAQEKVAEVRTYIHTIKGFKNITIVEREKSFGLADNIIDGITKVINQYGKIIVLEDDIVVSPVFLDYMNKALEHYQNKQRVWSISAWNYPLNPNLIKEDTFFWRIPHCWGWATWNSRWQYYRRDIQWVENNFNQEDIYQINLEGFTDFWDQYLGNKNGTIKTWAIFWYLIAYKHKALTLMPKQSLITQIGFDSQGTHCKTDSPYANQKLSHALPNSYPREIKERRETVLIIQSFLQKMQLSIFARIINKISRLFCGKNIIGHLG